LIKIFFMLKGLFKKKTNVKNEVKNVTATYEDAKMFLTSLISQYSSDFNVDSKRNILKAYRDISILNTVIKRSAKAFVRANKVLYKNDKIVEDGRIYDVLKKPHFLQSENEFWESVYINYSLFGQSFVRRKDTVGVGIKSLLSVATADTTPVIKDDINYLSTTGLNDIIDYYLINNSKGTSYKVTDIENIWNMQDVSLSVADNGLVANENTLSPIKTELGLIKTIEDVKQELIGNHGAIGFLSPDGKGEAGIIPLTKKDKKQITTDYFESHGITKGKDKLIISNKAVKFTSISLKIAELLLTEMQEKAELSIVNNFSFPTSLITDNATYENKDAGNKELYENKIIPESSKILTSFNDFLKLEELNMSYIFDYSHISFLQKDGKQQSEKNNLDTDNIIKLNESVSNNIMSRNNAIYQLSIQGYSNEDANNLIK